MSDEEIMVEYEAWLLYEGEALKTCPRCKGQTYRKRCPYCEAATSSLELTGDSLADDLFDRLERGEDVDLNLLRGPAAAQKETFEPVVPGGA